MDSYVGWFDRHTGFVQACLTFAYVVATFLILRATRRQLVETKRLESSRLRPYLSFDVEFEDTYVFAVLRNSGLTSAHDVHVTIEPTLSNFVVGAAEPSYLTQGLSIIVPGRTFEDQLGTVHDLPRRYPGLVFVGTMTYHGAGGEEYTEKFKVDVRFLKGHTFLGRTGKKWRYSA